MSDQLGRIGERCFAFTRLIVIHLAPLDLGIKVFERAVFFASFMQQKENLRVELIHDEVLMKAVAEHLLRRRVFLNRDMAITPQVGATYVHLGSKEALTQEYFERPKPDFEF